MTASDLFAYCESLGITLSVTPDGQLYYRAPKARFNLVLRYLLQDCKPPLVQLLTTGEDQELPPRVTFPEVDYTRFLTWRTGRVPANAQLMAAKLPAPTVHDVPHVPQTYQGRPCHKKGCKPTGSTPSGQPVSTYYRPSGLCVACYTRPKKHHNPKDVSRARDKQEI